MTVLQKSSKGIRSESGFSLIEVAIALIVIGLLLVPTIHTYNMYIESKKIAISQGVTSAVSAALIKYVEKYGYYPKPADPGIPQGTAGFGAANTAISGWATCTATSTTICQTNTNTYGGTVVLVGDVPFATLGIPFKTTLDGYNNKLTYAVTLSLTDKTTFDDAAGAIEVLDINGASIYSGTVQRAHYVVVSHGQNGDGAFTLGGVRTKACGTAPTGTEFENCNNDGTFRNNLDPSSSKLIRNYALGSTYFDDFVKTTNTIASGLWTYIPNSALEMQSSNLGNAYLGDPSVCAGGGTVCVPLAHLDVDGNVRSTGKVFTKRICDKDTSACVSSYAGTLPPKENPASVNWVSPMMFTGAPTTNPTDITNHPVDPLTSGYVGAGIRCYDNKALKGISNSDEICYNVVSGTATTSPYFAGSVTISNSCATGTYAHGISISGTTITLNCVSP